MTLSAVGSAYADGVYTTPVTVTLPGGVQQDDLVILAAASGGAGANGMGSGYTDLTGSPIAAVISYVNLATAWKLAGSSEANPQVTFAASQWSTEGAYVVRGVDTSTPIADQGQAGSGSSWASGITPSSLSAGGAAVWSVLTVVLSESASIVWPSGWTEVVQRTNTNQPTLGIAVNTSPGTGTVAPADVTWTGSHIACCFHLLVKEAAGGGATYVAPKIIVPVSAIRRASSW